MHSLLDAGRDGFLPYPRVRSRQKHGYEGSGASGKAGVSARGWNFNRRRGAKIYRIVGRAPSSPTSARTARPGEGQTRRSTTRENRCCGRTVYI
eukprot:scaffold956_cov389-Pavlova_lutheri.AAC.6